MIVAALMFVFGAWSVQQLAQLPSLHWLIFSAVMIPIILLTQFHPRFSAYWHSHKVLNGFLFGVLAFIFGFCWSSGFAFWRLSDELPHAWEQKTLQVIGVVASVPELTERGVRFKFDVEKHSQKMLWFHSILALTNTAHIKITATGRINLRILKRLQ